MEKIKPFILRNKYLISGATILLLSPLLFIISMYIISRNTKLDGPRGGPQDVFRHTYASAVTARYISPKIVKLVTFICERNPNSDYDKMDIHNNTLGLQIGLSKLPIYQTILEKIKIAEVNPSDSDTIYILEANKWRSSDVF
jgi:hypothetical protein